MSEYPGWGTGDHIPGGVPLVPDPVGPNVVPTPDQGKIDAPKEKPVPTPYLGNYIPGEGPIPCRVAIVGEAPGVEEDREGRPFVGPSGAILDTHLARFGLPRHQVYVTNIYKRRPSLNNDDPTPEQIAEGMSELIPELDQVGPRIIICLGRISAAALFDHYMGRGSFRDMDMMHGIPVETVWNGVPGGWLIPCYHPAAGMHEPRMMERFVWDLEQAVRVALTGAPSFERDISGGASYGDGYGYGPPNTWAGKFHIRSAAVDTEGTPDKPTHISWSITSNTGRVMKAQDSDHVEIVEGADITLHNAPWDLMVLDSLDKDLISLKCKITDTMVLSYVLQDEPQSLKNLAYKYRGKIRQGYEEVVDTHYLPALADWFHRAHNEVDLFVTHLVANATADWRKLHPEVKKLTKKVEADIRKALAASFPKVEALPRFKKIVDDLDKGGRVDLKARLAALDPIILANLPPPPPYSLDVVPDKEMVDYTCSDSDDTIHVRSILEKRVKDLGLEYVAVLDHAVLPMLHSFHKNGLPVDLDRANQLSAELAIEAILAHEKMKHISGREDLNPASGDQVAEVLQDLLVNAGLYDRQKKTKSGARMATDEKSLFMIRRKLMAKVAARGGGLSGAEKNLDDFFTALKAHRTATKTKGTFIDPTIERVEQGGKGRLFFQVKNTRVYSGRLSGDVFMWPRDKRVRGIFRCQEGHKIVTVDLSQIEPRTMAHLSGDPELCRIYKEGRDLYSESASQIMNRPLAEVGKGTDIRQAFKTIDLSMLYLISSPTLHENLLMDEIELYSLEDVANIRHTWLNETFKGIMPYYEEVWKEVYRDGEVRDMWGRRRLLPNIYLRPWEYDGWVRRRLEAMLEEAKRQAGNHKVQGGAQGLMKRSMDLVWRYVILPLKQQGIFVEPLLQVHDELVLEVEDDWAEIVRDMVKAQMEADSFWFRVPIIAEGGVGQSWAEAK
jgi:uracil-DNA glycosylase family 4